MVMVAERSTLEMCVQGLKSRQAGQAMRVGCCADIYYNCCVLGWDTHMNQNQLTYKHGRAEARQGISGGERA